MHSTEYVRYEMHCRVENTQACHVAHKTEHITHSIQYTYMPPHVHIHVHIHIHIHTHLRLQVHIHIQLHTHTHIHTGIRIHKTHIANAYECIHIHTHIHTSAAELPLGHTTLLPSPKASRPAWRSSEATLKAASMSFSPLRSHGWEGLPPMDFHEHEFCKF